MRKHRIEGRFRNARVFCLFTPISRPFIPGMFHDSCGCFWVCSCNYSECVLPRQSSHEVFSIWKGLFHDGIGGEVFSHFLDRKFFVPWPPHTIEFTLGIQCFLAFQNGLIKGQVAVIIGRAFELFWTNMPVMQARTLTIDAEVCVECGLAAETCFDPCQLVPVFFGSWLSHFKV